MGKLLKLYTDNLYFIRSDVVVSTVSTTVQCVFFTVYRRFGRTRGNWTNTGSCHSAKRRKWTTWTHSLKRSGPRPISSSRNSADSNRTMWVQWIPHTTSTLGPTYTKYSVFRLRWVKRCRGGIARCERVLVLAELDVSGSHCMRYSYIREMYWHLACI